MSETKRCFIFGAGEFTVPFVLPCGDDLVIAADGGWDNAVKLGIKPSLFIGDLDSSCTVPDCPDRIILRPRKDDTDTFCAVKTAISRGAGQIHLCCCSGGREDHTFANLSLLSYIASQAQSGFLYGNGFTACAVKNGSLRFGEDLFGTVSVFAWGGEAAGVNLTGLDYPLYDATIRCDIPLGVSNSFTGNPAEISVGDGTLIVMWSDRTLPLGI